MDHPNDEDLSLRTPMLQNTQRGWETSRIDLFLGGN
jgi:hypothetical protein